MAALRRGSLAALALLIGINLVNYIDRYMLSAVLTNIRVEFFGDDPIGFARVGWLSPAFLVTYLAMSPVFGFLADRVSRWAVIGVGVIFWSVASGASGLAAGFTAMLVTRMFVGVGEAAYGPAAPALIADLFSVEKRGRVLALFYMAIPVGSAIGFIWGGFATTSWGWRYAFYYSLIPGLALGLIALFFFRDPRHRAATGSGAQGQSHRGDSAHAHADAARQDGGLLATLNDYSYFFQIPSYRWNTLGMTAMTFALGGLAFWMPEYIHSFRGSGESGDAIITLDEATQYFGVITVAAGLTGTLLGGMIADRLRRRWSGAYFLVSAVGMILGVPVFLLVLYLPFPHAWWPLFLTEFFVLLNTGPANAVLANVVPSAKRASAFGLNILCIHLLGDAISPLLMGELTYQAKGNMNAGMSIVVAAIALSGCCWLMGARHLARDTQAALDADAAAQN